MKAARHDAIKEQGSLSEVVQTRARWRLFSGASFDGGKRGKPVTTRFIHSIYPLVSRATLRNHCGDVVAAANNL